MASTSCAVDGCTRKRIHKQYCGMHWMRMKRHGDALAPTQPRTKFGEALAFLKGLVGSTSNECVNWPYRTDGRGYGQLHYEGSARGAHRVMCLLQYGPAPDASDAAHSCGNALCVNPNHLRWATRKENAQDRQRHGTQLRGEKNPGAKLTVGDAEFILAHPEMPLTELASRFGVTVHAIFGIRHGKTWKHVRRVENAA